MQSCQFFCDYCSSSGKWLTSFKKLKLNSSLLHLKGPREVIFHFSHINFAFVHFPCICLPWVQWKNFILKTDVLKCGDNSLSKIHCSPRHLFSGSRMNSPLISQFVKRSKYDSVYLICICGPLPFMKQGIQFLPYLWHSCNETNPSHLQHVYYSVGLTAR